MQYQKSWKFVSYCQWEPWDVVTYDTLFKSQYLKLIVAVFNSCSYQSKNYMQDLKVKHMLSKNCNNLSCTGKYLIRIPCTEASLMPYGDKTLPCYLFILSSRCFYFFRQSRIIESQLRTFINITLTCNCGYFLNNNHYALPTL